MKKIMDYLSIPIGTKLEIEVINNRNLSIEKIKTKLVSRVLKVSKDGKLAIDVPIVAGNVYSLHENDLLEVIYMVNFELFRFNAKVVERTYLDNNTPAVVIKIDGNIQKIQRRNYFRIKVNLPIVIRYFSGEKGVVGIEDCSTSDISGGGLRITCYKKFNVNDIVECQLKIGENQKLSFIAEVRRVQDLAGGLYDVGMLFKKIEDNDREIIIKYIFEQQRILRKKGLI